MKPGHYIFRYGPLPNVGTGAKEVIMSIGGIKNEVCQKLNEKLIGRAFIPISDQGYTPVATVNGLNTALATSTTEDPAVYGQSDFCFGRSTAVNGCTVGVGYEGQFISVLIAR